MIRAIPDEMGDEVWDTCPPMSILKSDCYVAEGEPDGETTRAMLNGSNENPHTSYNVHETNAHSFKSYGTIN